MHPSHTLARSVVFHWVGALAFVFGPHHLKSSATMGILISRLFEGLFGSKEVRILILGLDNAGKTTILYRLQNESDEAVQTIPTIGFNVETLQYKNIKVRQRTSRAGGADGWRRRRRGRPAGGGDHRWSSGHRSPSVIFNAKYFIAELAHQLTLASCPSLSIHTQTTIN